MNVLKKTYKLFLTLCLIALGAKTGFAATLQDVPRGYWAEVPIVDCVNKGYLKITSDYKFFPNAGIKRSEFVNALLKVMQSDDVNTNAKAYFKDIDEKTQYHDDIAVSQAMGIVFGYPDKTFKPDDAITHAEAASVLANISKASPSSFSILEQFSDAADIPSWAMNSYAKAVEANLYVNHPDPAKLTPKSKMTKAEAAVLFARMSDEMDSLKERYTKVEKTPEMFLRQENLNIYERTPVDVVKVYNTKKIVEAGNVIIAHPTKTIDTKTLVNGSVLEFSAPEDLYSAQGTLLYRKGTRFTAKVQQVTNSTWLNKQIKALFVFDHAYFTDGTDKEMAAVAYTTKKGKVIFVKDSNTKKTYKESSKEITKGDYLLKYIDKLIPIVKTKITTNDDVYLLLTGDLIIPEKTSL